MMTLSRLRIVIEGCSGNTVSEEEKRALPGCRVTLSSPMCASVAETITAAEDAVNDDDATDDSGTVPCVADILCQ
jgi:hypothetical protein